MANYLPLESSPYSGTRSSKRLLVTSEKFCEKVVPLITLSELMQMPLRIGDGFDRGDGH